MKTFGRIISQSHGAEDQLQEPKFKTALTDASLHASDLIEITHLEWLDVCDLAYANNCFHG